MRKHTWGIILSQSEIPDVVRNAFTDIPKLHAWIDGTYLLQLITYDPLTDAQVSLINVASLSTYGICSLSHSSEENVMSQPILYQPISDATLASLPAFVALQIQEFVNDRTDDTFLYRELVGMVDCLSCQRMKDQISSWIGDDSDCCYFVHPGGSACWMCLGTHSTHLFDLIQPTMLPSVPDPYTWWVIKSEEVLEVYKITVRQVIEGRSS